MGFDVKVEFSKIEKQVQEDSHLIFLVFLLSDFLRVILKKVLIKRKIQSTNLDRSLRHLLRNMWCYIEDVKGYLDVDWN